MVDTLQRVSRLLIVDDQLMFRQGLRALLAETPDIAVVGEAADGEQALEKARELRPDVVLMDARLPGRDGLTATRSITRELPETKVIILTAHGAEADLIYRAVKAGATGYVSKLNDFAEVLATVRMVAGGQASIASRALTNLVSFIADGSEKHVDEPGHRLTDRELDVLDLVAQGCTNRAISERLCLSESTVRSHLHSILDKLHLTNRVQAAVFALSRQDGHGARRPMLVPARPARAASPAAVRPAKPLGKALGSTAMSGGSARAAANAATSLAAPRRLRLV